MGYSSDGKEGGSDGKENSKDNSHDFTNLEELFGLGEVPLNEEVFIF
ncbi:MAG: hypothetical protein K0S07_1059 [Chlamydiales bacterium]|nr:hypothetical protein [Chlamydiales bacterium]